MSNSKKLVQALSRTLGGNRVLTTPEECYAYSFDASDSLSSGKLPDAVVFVETKEEVLEVVKFARKYKTPIICRGAGTNTVGACKVEHNGIILNFSNMKKILEINKENMTAKVQPGVVLGDLQKAVEEVGLFYPPDPSNLKVSTVGGSIAQASAGAKSFKYGTTKNYILDLEVVTADVKVMHTGSNTVKNATGYDLTGLFVGSEGTLGIITEATLKLIPKPESHKVIMAYFDTVEEAVESVNLMISQRIFPTTIDFMDENAIKTVERFYPAGLLTDKEAALIIEIDGFEVSMQYQQAVTEEILSRCGASQIKISDSEEEYNNIWSARRASMGACALLKPNVTTDDVIVPRENLAKLIRGIRQICDKYGLICCMVGHVGDGSVHPQIPIDYEDEDEYCRYKKAKSEIYDLTARLSGLLSGEHGIGSEKRPYISKVLGGVALDCMRKIKASFDPDNILNPYKIF